MKVLFDFLTIRYLENSGIVTYASRVLDGWYTSGIKDVTILVSQYWADMCEKRWPNYGCIVIDVPYTGYAHRGWIVNRRRVKAINVSGCDVVFYPMPEPWFFQNPHIPQVTVIHDMLAPKIAKGKHWWYHHTLLPWQISRCKKVLAISQYTKKEALRIYKFLSPQNVVVVHNPLKWDERSFTPLIKEPYVLCVNTISPYKNGLTLAKAFARIKDKTDCKLVFVGIIWGDYWEQIEQIAKENGFSDRLVHLENLQNEELVALYQHAKLFVSPSTMEGFGQTPIEAAIYGCPVITSRETALPETTLGLVRYYEPVMSDESLAKQMESALFNPPTEKEASLISEKLKVVYDTESQAKKIYNVLLQTTMNLKS